MFRRLTDRVPLSIVITLVVDLKRSSATAMAREGQVAVTKIGAGHISRRKITDHEYQTGTRF